MSNGICPKCGKEMEWDDGSEIWFCSHCNNLFDEDEASSSTKWFFETLLMWIPGVNLLLIYLTKDRLKKMILTNMFLSCLFMMLIILFGASFYLYQFRGNIYEDIIRSRNKLKVTMMHELDIEVPEYTPVKLPDLFEYTPLETKASLNEDALRYLDNSYIDGEKVRQIITDYNDKYYLINSFTVREKFGPSIYLALGKVFEECEWDDVTEFGKYDISKYSTFTQSDKYCTTDKIDDKGKVYYIYSTSYFKVKIIRDKYDNVLGLQFTEEVLM